MEKCPSADELHHNRINSLSARLVLEAFQVPDDLKDQVLTAFRLGWSWSRTLDGMTDNNEVLTAFRLGWSWSYDLKESLRLTNLY